MTNAIIEDMVRMFYQQQVLAPLGDWLFGTGSGGGGGGGGGLFAAIGDWFVGLFGEGAAFDRGDLIAFAGGGIIDEPTLFPLAGGRVGLMGEAGPEAIVPLRRLDDGRLGIASDGARGSAVTRLSATARYPMPIVRPCDDGHRVTYVVNVDARGATDPEATAALVHRVVAEALTQVVPGIVEHAAGSAYGAVVDQFHRRGGKFN